MATTTYNLTVRSHYPDSSQPSYTTSLSSQFKQQETADWEMQAAAKWEQNLQTTLQQVPQKAALLRPLITFLVTTLQPARIYALPHLPGQEAQHFTVMIVLPGTAPALETFRPILDMVYLQHRHAWCTVYSEGNLLSDLKNNALYALLHFNAANLVYDNSHLIYPVPEPEQLQQAQQKARETFALHFTKAQIFLELAQTNIHNNEIALFLLHQAMELTCRSMLFSLGGYNIREHSLQVLFKHLRRHAPHLLEIFAAEKDKTVLDKLEKSYIAARYEATFKVTPDIIPYLVDKITQFQHMAATTIHQRTT